MSHRRGKSGTSPAAGGEPDGNRLLVRIGIVFLVCVISGFVAWLLATGEAGSLMGALRRADSRWVAAGAACFVAYFLLDALCFRVAGTLSGKRLGALDLISTAASGVVCGYLTPGQMGTQPAQIVRLAKAGLSVGDATAIQLTRYFIYQVGLTIFGTVMLLTRLSFFKEAYGQVVLAAMLAFLVHLGIMAGLVAVIFFPDLVRRLARFVVRLGSRRLHVIKDPEAALSKVDAEVDQYATSVHRAVRHAGIVASAVIFTFLQLISIYLVPYCVLGALGVSSLDPYTCVAAAAFVQLILTAVPLPGGTGGAEGGFALFFGAALGDDLTAAIVMWRSITYYLPIICSAPLMGVKSKIGPAERHEAYGDPRLGPADLAQGLQITHERAKRRRRLARRPRPRPAIQRRLKSLRSKAHKRNRRI